ncbi:hypothetical protein [Pseudarthrobacter cellobiosi]|uniref:hypothetical protein n=1 Tax=Pseudarthrobacter cellobiosi TaxID=2953654 RepID=UPI00208E8B0B|nr:hypothetical protein [Pseudarthrobacter sp. HLT1-5]MCO4257409.1 hypothetical protein [Pseudarthrobacter sp. HLT1-5]
MSATTITAAIQSFLAPTAGLTKLYKDAPWEMSGDNWQSAEIPGTPGFIHLDNSSESRIALGGEFGGKKQVDYTVSLVLLYQYLIPSDLAGADKDVWVNGLNTLLDNVVTRMRSDRSFGCAAAGPIFEAGNQDQGIAISRDLPHWDHGGGKVRAWVRVEFKVTEIVNA